MEAFEKSVSKYIELFVVTCCKICKLQGLLKYSCFGFKFSAVKVPYPEDTKSAAISEEEKEFVSMLVWSE